jgi:ammonia channel protein AmtB
LIFLNQITVIIYIHYIIKVNYRWIAIKMLIFSDFSGATPVEIIPGLLGIVGVILMVGAVIGALAGNTSFSLRMRPDFWKEWGR